jgi:putative isomerase
VSFDANTDTMNLDDVGLNALYALDAECLAKIAEILGRQDDARVFVADHARMKTTIQNLWNDEDGIFENRYWDGRFSKRLSPTNFYPLIAGLATPQQAERMIKDHLLNPNEFWGQYVMPTIARNDAVFKDQYYWRGDIWAPTNYLVYEGLNRYRHDGTALEFAEKSYDLFQSDWLSNQHSDENYSPWGGSAGGDPHYTWGTLMCLIPLEQFMDKTPWDGLRFGALNPPREAVLSGYEWADHRYNVTIGPNRTAIERDGKLQIEADAGVVFRNVDAESGSLSFSINTVRQAHITIRMFASRAASMMIDHLPAKGTVTQDRAVTITIPAGQHDFSGVWNG